MATEKRLISPDAFWDNLDLAPSEWVKASTIKAILDETPTVDAVEVVRCKDCKHSTWDEEEHLWECTNSYDLTGDADTYAMFHEYNDGEHYCSYGERKDND